jgi:hypothetical protein
MSVEWCIFVLIGGVGLVLFEQLRLMTQQLDRIRGLLSEMKWQRDEDAGRHDPDYRGP